MNLNSQLIMFMWLAVLVISLIAEAATVGLTCIWVAGGAVAALIANLLGAGLTLQVIIFFIVTFVLLFFTRPFAEKYINSRRVRTNYEVLIGKRACIEETVDNVKETGKTTVNGQEWTVRSEKDEEVIEKGSLVEIVRISGVKLIVHKLEEETR